MPRHLRSLPLSGLLLSSLAHEPERCRGDHGQGLDYKTQPGAACQPVSATGGRRPPAQPDRDRE